MRGTLTSISQLVTMSAIVATLAYFPMGALIVLTAWLFGVSPAALATFGGALHMVLGLLAWWLFAFAGACAYAVFVFPWSDKVLAWPGRE
jgi:hypothetical protein